MNDIKKQHSEVDDNFKRLSEIKNIKVEIIGKGYIPTHRGNYNILAGNGGVGKSLIALKMLVDFLVEKPKEQAYAFFSEDTRKEIESRLDFIVRGSSITVDEVLKRTFFVTLDNDHGKVFAFMDGRSPVSNMEYFTDFVNGMVTYNIGFVILDPLERFHTGLSENDEGHMKFLVTSIFQKIGVITGASVLVLHHTSKGDLGGARGSGVITNKGRVAYNVRKNMVFDKESGITTIRDGWQTSVIISTIKDNHFVAKWCDPISKEDGRLDLPIKKHIDYTVIEYEMEEEL